MRMTFPALGKKTVRKTRVARGFTLIEVMVAALLLLIAMAGIVPLFMSGLSQASTIRLKSVATNVAREKMEMVRQLDYREIYTEAMRAADHTLGTRTLESLFGTSETVRGSAFTISYAVASKAYQDGTLKEVTVDVGWAAPPKVSAASMTTLIHQQFLGPRGSRLDLTPTSSDPLNTPFELIANTTKARYYIAQADWSLIFYDLSQATPAPRNVYMRLALFDDNGQSLPIGPSGNGYQIDTSYVRYSRDTGGAINAVWFEYDFDAAAFPDGYWETQAVAYNEYGEPGNTWRFRVRIEKEAPTAPTSFSATPQGDNHTVVLAWASGPERDRDHYVLERRKWDVGTGAWLSWVTVASGLDPNVTTYTDVGNVGAGQDPWGNGSTQNCYQYSLWAVDICNPGLVGASVQTEAYIPPSTTTTSGSSTTTTVVSTTTTTVGGPTTTVLYWVQIQNNSNTSYNVVVKDGSGTTVYSGTAKKSKVLPITGLHSGSYQITATASGKPTLNQSFSLPAQAGATVLTIF